MSYVLTKDQVREEIKKCGRDPTYFITNYCKIAHPEKGLIPFSLYDYQQETIKAFEDYRFNIVLKARQLGLSTAVAGYIAWMLLFRRQKTVLVVATKLDVAANLVKKVKKMIKSLPSWLNIADISIDNRNSFELNNGSWIKASSTSESAGRSEALSLLVIDEAAFVEGMEDLWKSIFPTLSAGGRCIAISCVTKDTLVFTDKGIRKVEDFIVKDKVSGYEIEQYNVLGRDTTRSSNIFYNNGFVKTKKITTKYSHLEGSYNHKMWAYSEKDKKFGWYKLEQLQVGDYLSVQYGKNLWGNNDDVSSFVPSTNAKIKFEPKTINKELAYFLGLFLAEGYARKFVRKEQLQGGQLTITCGDGIKNSLEELKMPVYSYDNLHYHINSENLVEFLEYLGFDLKAKAKNKIIPTKLLSMSKENTCALLQGIFDGDGYSRKDRGQVGIGLSSKVMIEQIRMLLLNLGILTEYKEYTTKPTKMVKVYSTQHRLSLNSSESIKFYNIVGFSVNRKQYNKHIVEKIANRASSHDVVPGVKEDFINIKKQLKLGNWTLQKKYDLNMGSLFIEGREISRSNCIKFLDIVKENIQPEKTIELEKNINNNIIWTKITKIEDGENETYDFSLPSNPNDFWDHSVVYNGFLGHQTPNGVGSWFHETYINAENGINDFHSIKLNWDAHPERDRDWFEAATRNMNRRDIAQEFQCSFNASGEGVIDSQILQEMRESALEPKYRTGFDRNYWIWEEARQEFSYLLVADVARGDGKDFSAFHVIKLETMEQVAEYQGKVAPDIYADMLFQTGKEYNNALIVVENNNIGFNVLEKLIERKYPNIYYSIKSTHEYIEQAQAENMSNSVPGFTTTQRTRPLVVSKLEEFIRNKMIKIYSNRIIEELSTFVWSNGRPEAMKNRNDDLTMSLAIACWVRDTALTTSQRDVEYTKAMFNAITMANTRVQTKIPGQIGYNGKYSLDEKRVNQRELKEFYKMYDWLYKG